MIAALVFAELSDLLTFICAMSVLPITAEANPIARAVYGYAGAWGVIDLKIIGTAALILLIRKAPKPQLWGSIAIGLAIIGALSNTISVALT